MTPTSRSPSTTTFGQKRSLWQTTSPAVGAPTMRCHGACSSGRNPAWASCIARRNAPSVGHQLVRRRNGGERRGPLEKREDLASALVEPEHARYALEPGRLEMAEQRVHSRCVRADRSPDRGADADDDVVADMVRHRRRAGPPPSREVDPVLGQLREAAVVLGSEHRAHRLAHSGAGIDPDLRVDQQLEPGECARPKLIARIARSASSGSSPSDRSRGRSGSAP